jgi:hypothetical protein
MKKTIAKIKSNKLKVRRMAASYTDDVNAVFQLNNSFLQTITDNTELLTKKANALKMETISISNFVNEQFKHDFKKNLRDLELFVSAMERLVDLTVGIEKTVNLLGRKDAQKLIDKYLVKEKNRQM